MSSTTKASADFCNEGYTATTFLIKASHWENLKTSIKLRYSILWVRTTSSSFAASPIWTLTSVQLSIDLITTQFLDDVIKNNM